VQRVDWTPVYYLLWTIAAGAVVVGLVLIAAKLRVRPLAFTAVGLVLLAGGVAYIEYRDSYQDSSAQDQSPTGLRSTQPAGQSTVGRNDPGVDQNDQVRAPNIAKSEKPVGLSDAQRQKIRGYLAEHGAPKVDRVDFSLVVGSAVPEQVPLQDLPLPVADALGGYNGDKYLVVGDQMIIVEAQTRRIVAVLPGVA
jgi:hypothetical protein